MFYYFRSASRHRYCPHKMIWHLKTANWKNKHLDGQLKKNKTLGSGHCRTNHPKMHSVVLHTYSTLKLMPRYISIFKNNISIQVFISHKRSFLKNTPKCSWFQSGIDLSLHSASDIKSSLTLQFGCFYLFFYIDLEIKEWNESKISFFLFHNYTYFPISLIYEIQGLSLILIPSIFYSGVALESSWG